MARKNTFTKKTTLFTPSTIRSITGGNRSTVENISAASLSGSMTSTTGSFRHDPPGSPLKSTQQLPIDWSKFENHTFFNSAESKVNVAFERVINYYPFDGSRGETIDFMDSLTGFEKWVFDKFPKHTGFLNFGGYQNDGTAINQHLVIKDAAGLYMPTLSRDKTGDPVIDPGVNKSLAFEFHINIPTGSASYTHAGSSRTLPSGNQILFQRISDVSGTFSPGTHDGVTIYMDQAALTEPSGTIKMVVSSGSLHASSSMKIQKGAWTHICAQFNRVPGIHKIQLYRDGKYVNASDTVEMYDFGFADQPLRIGSGSNHIIPLELGRMSGTIAFTQQFSGSLDDFRLWHAPRNARGLDREKWTNVSPRKSLRLYYKFNEPTGSYGGNSTILDYSGNSLHGSVTSFHSSSRETKGLENPVRLEITADNPVLFPSYLPLLDLNSDLLTSASLYDANNPNTITKLVPKHYLEEAAVFEGFGQEADLGDTGAAYGSKENFPGGGKIGSPQIMAALLFTWAKYFDEMKMFIDQFGKLMHVDRVEEGTIADTFLPFFAQYFGFHLPEMFPEASLDQFTGKTGHVIEPKVASNSLQNIQNVIWRRILSDTSELIKSKGTIHGIKVFMRNMGINPDRTFRFREFGGSPSRNITDVRDAYTEMNSLGIFSGSYAKDSGTRNAIGVFAKKPFVQSPFLITDRDEPGKPEPIGNRSVRFDKLFDPGYSAGDNGKADLAYHWRPHKNKMDSVYTTSSAGGHDNIALGDSIDATYHFDDLDGRRQTVNGRLEKIATPASDKRKAVLSDSTPFTKYVGDTHGQMKSVLLNRDPSKNTTEWVSSSFHLSMSDGSGNDAPFTVGGWFKLLATGTNQGLFQIGTGSFGAPFRNSETIDGTASRLGMRLYVTASTTPGLAHSGSKRNGLAFEIFNGASHASLLRKTAQYISDWTGDGNINNVTNKWHHVMATYDGSKSTNGMKLYLNGALLTANTSGATTGSYSAASTGSFQHGVRIGSVYGDSDPALNRAYLTGAISDWAVWSRSLNAHENKLVYGSAPDGNIYAGEFKEKPFRSAVQDGLLTSGSWSYEGYYRFPQKGETGIANHVTQSLVRFSTTGSVGPIDQGAVAHRMWANLVAFSGSMDTQTTGSLTLFVRPQVNGPVFKVPLTGTDVFDGDKWHVSFGRTRNDLTGSIVSSSYFLRAGKVKNGKLVQYNKNEKWLNDHKSGLINVCEILTGTYNASGTFFVIGNQGLSFATGSSYGNDGNASGSLNYWDQATMLNNETFFGGRVAQVRFWSKGLTERETKEHTLNYRSLGVIDPQKNFNFIKKMSGSFERLRLDASFSQPVTKSADDGTIKVFDFSQNNFHLSGSGFQASTRVIAPETWDFAMLSPNFDQARTGNKVRIRSFKSRQKVDLHKAKFAPLHAIPANESPRDDTRFSIEISVVQALNEDIVNIFGTLDALDNYIGGPELQFSQDYPEMAALRDVYFNRLESKLNIPKFFEFFRWFDGTIGNMIELMVPRKTKFLGINFVVESHMLERAKFHYNSHDMYIGPNDRHGLKGQILLQQFLAEIMRY